MTTTITPKAKKEKLEVERAPKLFDFFFRPLESPLGRYFDDFMNRRFFEETERMITPALDLGEDDGIYVITLEMPGIKKEDAKIEYESGILTVSGEKKSEVEKEGKSWHRLERRFGSFYRSLTLPTDVDIEDAEATFKDGVLTIRLPKTEAAKPKSIQVT
ncbi:MAG: Hsp20/alpha crystallin family protein [Planctomycetota bacterium]|jgi:HSP20 family protein